METFLLLTLDLDTIQQSNCEKWVARFGELIGQSPLNVHCQMEWPEGSFRQAMVGALQGEDLATVTTNVSNVILDHPRCEVVAERTSVRLPKFVVFCNRDHSLAKTILAASPQAEWGASNGRIAVIYELQSAVAWHEMLHLLGAKDCYPKNNPDQSTLPTCGHDNCIMQYAPTLGRVGDPFFLCRGNVQQIQQSYSDTPP
jgi:hypothetical protein